MAEPVDSAQLIATAVDVDRRTGLEPARAGYIDTMITAGVLLIIVGILVGVPVLTTLGTILAIIGAVFLVLGQLGRPAGRPHYW
jgi:hypothetical protein